MKGSFSLRASDKAGVSRTRTEAKDLATVSRGIRMHLGSAAAGAAALRAYTELDDSSVLSFGSAARIVQAALPSWLEDDWRVHVARRRGFSMPRRANVVGHLLTLLPDEVVEHDGVRLTSPARTWLDLASILNLDELVVAGDSLVCSHGPDFPMPREALCTVDELWPDAAYPEQRVALQYEGAHHNGSDQYLKDIRRADTTTECGWIEVRVSKFDLAGGRPAVVSKVRTALESRGWRAK
ncbi:hypothetical protein [Arthrobacter sp. R4-81]